MDIYHAVIVDAQGSQDSVLGDLEAAVQVALEGGFEVKIEEEADEAGLQGADKLVAERVVGAQA